MNRKATESSHLDYETEEYNVTNIKNLCRGVVWRNRQPSNVNIPSRESENASP